MCSCCFFCISKLAHDRKITKYRTCSSCGNDDVKIKWNKWNSQMHIHNMHATNQVLVIFAESQCLRASSWCLFRFLHSFGVDFHPFGMHTGSAITLILHLFVAFYFLRFFTHTMHSIFMYLCMPTKHMFHLKLVFFVRFLSIQKEIYSWRRLLQTSIRKCGCIRNQFHINCYTHTINRVHTRQCT